MGNQQLLNAKFRDTFKCTSLPSCFHILNARMIDRLHRNFKWYCSGEIQMQLETLDIFPNYDY